MRPRTPLLIMAAIHAVAIVVLLILVGMDAGQTTETPARFTPAAGWLLAGILLAPIVTIGAIVWSVILRRRSRTSSPRPGGESDTRTAVAQVIPPPPVESTRPDRQPASRPEVNGRARGEYATRAEARAAAASEADTTRRTTVHTPAPASQAPPPPSAPHRTNPVPYVLLGSDKYKSTEVEGEFARTSEIAAVVKSITGRALRVDQEVEIPDVFASLRTEPHNRYHRRAIMVVIDGSHVGYLARDDADRYHSAISKVEAAGYIPTIRARLWAVERRGWDGPTKVHARVSLALNEPHLLYPVNEPPTISYSLLPWGNAVQVTGEENHLEAIAPHVNPGSESIAIGTLHRVETTSTRGVLKQTVEVRIDGRAVGSLTATTSPHYLPTIQHLEREGHTAAAWLKIKGSPIAAQVTVQAARAPELSPEWFLAPTRVQPLSPRTG